jgi:hypothetical protein
MDAKITVCPETDAKKVQEMSSVFGKLREKTHKPEARQSNRENAVIISPA